MLMTVLKGDLAVQQSRALIRTFRAMKDYIIENQDLVGRHEFTQLQLVVSKNKDLELSLPAFSLLCSRKLPVR